jgi:hypothetical protein
MLVSNDNQGAEIKTASAFDNFGRPVDEHHLLDQLLTGLGIECDFRLGPIAALTASSARRTRIAAFKSIWFRRSNWSDWSIRFH